MQGLGDRIRAQGQPSESSGLAAADQRSLLRLIFLITAGTLAFFSLLQTLETRYWLAAVEISTSLLLFWAAWQIPRARNITLWVYVYLIPLFCFLVYIVSMPDASVSAFVWVYLVPILSYLLLGRRAGFCLAVPVITLTAVAYLWRFGIPADPQGWIDVGNAMLCNLLVLVCVHLYEGRRAAAQRALRSMAEIDALTGVANRGHFQACLERSIKEGTRTGSAFVLVILDVDLFKEVNDRWGHDAGDAALRHICSCMAERLRATDFIGRLGGEEFGIVLSNTDTPAAVQLIDDLRNRIVDNHLQHERHSISLSATFGLAEWPVDGDSVETLYRSADRRLYRGKAAGRNQLISGDEA